MEWKNAKRGGRVEDRRFDKPYEDKRPIEEVMSQWERENRVNRSNVNQKGYVKEKVEPEDFWNRPGKPVKNGDYKR